MLPLLNLAALKGGPAIVKLGPAVFYTKNGVDLDASGEWEDLIIDGYDVVDKRKKKQPFKVKFTPDGVYTAQHVAVACALASLTLGQFITPRFYNITGNDGNNQLTVTAHGRITGESCYIAASDGGVIPSGLNAATLYYINVVDANTITLHASLADAIANANTVALTDNGAAPFSMVINNQLVIWSYTGDVLTFGNYGMESVPDTMFTADGKTIFGELNIGCFLRHGYRPQDANSYFTLGNTAFDPTTFPNLAQILTQPYEANWGGEIRNITNVSVANPSVLTTDVPHGFVTGQMVKVVAAGSTPALNGSFAVTVLTATTFSIVENVTGGTNAGTVQRVVTPPWDNVETKDGFKLKFNAKVEDVLIDGLGVPTRQLTGATAEISFLPTNAGLPDLLNALNTQGASGQLGSSLAAGAFNFNWIGNGLYGVLYAANFTKAPAKWNMKDRRAGEVTLTATRQIVGGVAQPLMFLGVASPY